jgi:hypothetical protein
MLTHLIAVAMQSIGARQIGAVARECPDSNVLRRGLDALNSIYDSIVLNVLNRADVLEVISQLLAQRAEGLPVSLEPGKPLLYYQKQVWRNNRRFLEIQISKLPYGHPYRAGLERELANERLVVRVWYTFVPEIGFSIGRPNVMEAETRERVSRARIDLVRLLIAQRIRELNSEDVTTSSKQLAESLNFTDPVDPFTGLSYKWSEARREFYCAGPNKSDEGMHVEYDPTNGTFSSGDVPTPGLEETTTTATVP